MGSKLNMKSAQYGSPVEWHPGWGFYPHSNDAVRAVGVLLDDSDLENGQMMVPPRSHTSQSVWNHHGDDGCFAGLIDPDLIQDEINRAVPCAGKAGGMSFHHVRALHGSATNTSNKPRNLVLYEVAASDAWPLMGVKDFAEYDSRCWWGARWSRRGSPTCRCECRCRRRNDRARSTRPSRRRRSPILPAQHRPCDHARGEPQASLLFQSLLPKPSSARALLVILAGVQGGLNVIATSTEPMPGTVAALTAPALRKLTAGQPGVVAVIRMRTWPSVTAIS